MDKKEAIFTGGNGFCSQRRATKAPVFQILPKTQGSLPVTFYLYFESKIQLFMDIYLSENKKLKREVMGKVDLTADPRAVVRQVMMLNMEGMNANPILREWYNRDVFAKIEQKYREEKGLVQVDFMYSIFLDIIKKWQAEGKMRTDFDGELIMAMFTAIINIDFHKEEIGIQYFPEILDYLFGFLMDGLLID